MQHPGELAAFGTAVCWTMSALFFEKASRRIGALAVNFYKVVSAFFFLAVTAWLVRGVPFPTDASASAWIYLSISGFVGFVIADYFLFNAYILIGSRITVIFQALTPLFTAFLAFVILGERMKPERMAGMALVIAGILVVVISRQKAIAKDSRDMAPGKRPVHDAKASARGLVFAFLSSVFQATGLIFSKIGLGSYGAIPGTQIRIITAIIGFALQALLLGQAKAVFVKPWKDASTMRTTAIGSIFGPFLGVSLSLFALQTTNAGAASTLMALTPVLIIPPSIFLLKQKVRLMEIVGAGLAVSGAALFFLL